MSFFASSSPITQQPLSQTLSRSLVKLFSFSIKWICMSPAPCLTSEQKSLSRDNGQGFKRGLGIHHVEREIVVVLTDANYAVFRLCESGGMSRDFCTGLRDGGENIP
jgi:hypothetical protein